MFAPAYIAHLFQPMQPYDRFLPFDQKVPFLG
jgi:hypothetical protein